MSLPRGVIGWSVIVAFPDTQLFCHQPMLPMIFKPGFLRTEHYSKFTNVVCSQKGLLESLISLVMIYAIVCMFEQFISMLPFQLQDSGPAIRLNGDPNLSLSSESRCLMLVFGWAHRGSN